MKLPVKLTYAEVKKRHPEELQKLVTQLRNSSSKHKDADASAMRFEYTYCIECSLDRRYSATVSATVEDKVADLLSRISPVNLTGKIGRWYTSIRVPNPPELEVYVRECAEKEVAERNRIDSLTDSERQAEVQKILKELRNLGAFYEH
jgi:hypothetical protein